jgi:hypothetical protein
LGGGLNVYGFNGGDPVNFSDPFGLCATPDGSDDGKPCQGPVGEMVDAANAKLKQMYDDMGGKASEVMGKIIKQTAKGVVQNTTISVDVTAGVVTTSFAADATHVDLSSDVALRVVVTATFIAPDAPSGVRESFGGTMGEGPVGGASVIATNGQVVGGSASAGVGVSLPAAKSLVMKVLRLFSVTVAEDKNR